MRTPLEFCSPFNSANEVRVHIERRRAEREASPRKRNPIRREEAFAAGTNVDRGIDVRMNLKKIYKWKMKAFQRFHLDFPDRITDEELNTAIEAARNAIRNPQDKRAVFVALDALKSLRGIGVPTASAILTAMNHKDFAIIDRQAFKALGVQRFRARIEDYIDYLRFCRNEAERLGVSLDCHDQALWQRGREISAAKKNSN
jgi:thermostable 8-oxoguanine DNA glycosylase